MIDNILYNNLFSVDGGVITPHASRRTAFKNYKIGIFDWALNQNHLRVYYIPNAKYSLIVIRPPD